MPGMGREGNRVVELGTISSVPTIVHLLGSTSITITPVRVDIGCLLAHRVATKRLAAHNEQH
jgi:hypothetical protein